MKSQADSMDPCARKMDAEMSCVRVGVHVGLLETLVSGHRICPKKACSPPETGTSSQALALTHARGPCPPKGELEPQEALEKST